MVAGVIWEPAEISVEGIAKPFEVCQFDNGYWVGVGRAPEADVTIESRGVPRDAVDLVRMEDPPPERARAS